MSDNQPNFERLAAGLETLRSKQVFFLCGAPKSGTTWLQIMLDAHPAIVCNGEGHFCDQLLPALGEAISRHNGVIAEKNRTIFGELRGYPLFRPEHALFLLGIAISLTLGEQAAASNVVAVGEKSPDNIRFLPVLARLFARAKFIHVIRDGRDGAVSCWFHNQRVTPGWAERNFAGMDEFVARYAVEWEQTLRAGRDFAAARPRHYLEIRYEDMVADTVTALTRAFAFLGVPADDAMLRACSARGAFESLSGGRRRGEEDRNSFFRKGAVGDWRAHLSESAAARFAQAAGQWLSALGYPVSRT